MRSKDAHKQLARMSLTHSCPIKLQSKLTFDLLYFFSQLGFRIEMKAIPHFKGYEMGFQKKIFLSETTHNTFDYINLIYIN